MNSFQRWKNVVALKNPAGADFFMVGVPEVEVRVAFGRQDCAPTREYCQLVEVSGGLIDHPEIELSNQVEPHRYLLEALHVAIEHRRWSEIVTEYDSHLEAGLSNRFTDFIMLANDEAGSYVFVPCAKEIIDESPVIAVPKADDAYIRYQSLSAMFQTLAEAFETGALYYELMAESDNGAKLVQTSEFSWLQTGILPERGWYLRSDKDKFRQIARRLNPNVDYWRNKNPGQFRNWPGFGYGSSTFTIPSSITTG